MEKARDTFIDIERYFKIIHKDTKDTMEAAMRIARMGTEEALDFGKR